jgi:hypothetical protein
MKTHEPHQEPELKLKPTLSSNYKVKKEKGVSMSCKNIGFKQLNTLEWATNIVTPRL